jgi:hypothetical protein
MASALIARVKALPWLLLREIAADLEREGKVTAKGNRYSASAIQSMRRSGLETEPADMFISARPVPQLARRLAAGTGSTILRKPFGANGAPRSHTNT